MKKPRKNPKTKKRKLNYKQKKFAECYEGNGVDAVRKAGYSGNDATLRAMASKLLTKNNILDAIEKRQKKEESKRNATRQEKLELLTDFMRDDSALKVEIKDGIEEIIPNIKHSDRLKAVELHCKMNGDLILKHEHSGHIGISMQEGLKKIADHLKSHPKEEKKMLEELEDD